MAPNTESWSVNGKSRRKACGECRRLKLRCEKVFPCDSCQKRGCAAICPNGSFLKGTRSLKTSALKLHEKMAHMSARIQELEDALADLQASVSAEKHPLLQGVDDDERSRSPIPVASVTDGNIPIGETSDELSEALGTLTIRPFGESQFHGETAASEFLLQVNSDTQILATSTGWDPNAHGRMQLPADIVLLSVLFPFPPSIPGEPISIDRFLPFLPEYREAMRISEVYYANFAWCSMPITKEELHETIFAEVFGRGQTTLQHISLHRLSLLLMVFAIGTLFDIDKSLYPAEAEEYHSLARAALCGEQIFNNTTLDFIDDMVYEALPTTKQRLSMGLFWTTVKTCPSYWATWAAQLRYMYEVLISMFIDRESSKNISTQEIMRRQATFWEYISGDIWQSFVYGRPSSMVFSQIDCKKPKELGGLTDKTAALFYKWKYSFTHLVGDVLAQTTGATATNYRNILELERKLRDFPLPSALKLPESRSPSASQDVPLTLMWQRYVIRLWQHTTIMAIHRRFLVQAIRTNGDDLTKSQFLQSVYAAYESALIPIQDLVDLYEAQPRVVSRMQPYWSHAFSAAIVLGALVSRSPSCIVAESAMAHLDQACALFADARTLSVQPPRALEMMTNLQRKASAALSDYRRLHGGITPSQEYNPLGSSSTSHDTRKSSSPTSSHTLDSPLQFMHAATAAATVPEPPTWQSAQAQANYAAQWMQQQAYFPPDTGTSAGVYEAGRNGVAEDDEYAARWLHQQAYYTERQSSEGRDTEMLQYGLSSVMG